MAVDLDQWFSNYEVELPREVQCHVKGGASCESFFYFTF